MTRSRSAKRTSMFQTRPRFSSRRIVSFVAALMLATGASVAGQADVASESIRVAVAPFAGDTADSPVAVELVGQLDLYALERLIAPDAFVADAIFDPSAEQVRRWAYNAAVESVVVGRVTLVGGAGSKSEQPLVEHQIDVIIRSGHSGAELARHSVRAAHAGDYAAATKQLAAAILNGLGYSEPAPDSVASRHAVGEGARPGAARSPGEGGATGGHGFEASLDLAGFKNNAPIEIKADEAEIMNRGQNRKLIFQHNVRVQQSNVILRSDRLEASYRKGESEPDRLDARGKVFVDQAGRQAKCDHAVYVRAGQLLTCTGHAELVQGCDIVRGESIEFDLSQDRARVEGAASIVIRPEGPVGSVCGSVGDLL